MVGRTNVGAGGSTGSSAWAYINAAYPTGSICTATNGTLSLTAEDTSGLYTFSVPQPSGSSESWTVTCTDNLRNKSQTATIDTHYQVVSVELQYGRLPVGYQEVEYIQSNGVPYIALDAELPTVGMTVDVTYMLMNGSAVDTCVCGCWDGSQYDGYTLGYVQSENIRHWIVSSMAAYSIAGTGTKVVLTVNNNNSEVVENGVVLGSVNGSGTLSRKTKFDLFGMNSIYGHQAGSTARIYSFQAKNKTSGTYIYDLVPCYNTSSNVIGMYDLVSNTFLTNSGSGTFTKGANV